MSKMSCNFSAISPSGEESLYDYYQKPIVLDLSTMWCGYCQVAGLEAQEMQDLYAEHDLVYLTVLIEDFEGNPPDLADIENWKTTLGIDSAPVWASSRDIISDDPAAGWSITGWPTFYFIDRNMKVQGLLRGYSQQMIIDGIEIIIKEDTGSAQ